MIIKKQSQSGFALMFVIVFSVILFSVGLTITRITTQDAKVAKLEEDESVARAAAEAGIEAAIGQGTDVDDIGAILNDPNLSGDAVFEEEVAPEFITPLISKDAQYTFYLTGYDSVAKHVFLTDFSDNIVINKIQPAETTCTDAQAFAVEITLIDASPITGGIVQRYLIEQAGCNIVAADAEEVAFGEELPIGGIVPGPHILLARIIAPHDNFDGAKLEFVNASGTDFPAQGSTIISTASIGEAKEQNVTKKVKLFRSHPQFPAEFFVTSL